MIKEASKVELRIEVVSCYLVLKVWRGNPRTEKSGDDDEEEPPVPMPNTEVKLFNADDS